MPNVAVWSSSVFTMRSVINCRPPPLLPPRLLPPRLLLPQLFPPQLPPPQVNGVSRKPVNSWNNLKLMLVI